MQPALDLAHAPRRPLGDRFIPSFGIGDDELVVVGFAGGGGSCEGIEAALGRPVDIAINHDPEAVAMHRANHPRTRHYCQSILRVRPLEAVGGRPVGLAWFSPDCKHFSKAKGAKPVDRNIRDLAWVVVTWAKELPPELRPRIIMLENVEEFRDWGPLIRKLGPDGEPILDVHGSPLLEPCPRRKGQTYMRWVGELRKLGGRIEWRELVASKYGVPTSRKRLYVIIRFDGRPIVWPEETHGPEGSGLQPYRTAAECIDWSIDCPSIFLTKEEGRKVNANRPLVDATMRRVAKGVRRYVLESPKPFIVGVGGRMGQSPARGVDRPYQTATSKADAAVAMPFLAPITHQGDDRVYGAEEGFRTLTCAQRGEQAVVSPVLVPYHGERRPGEARGATPDDPLKTQPTENSFSLVVPYLVPRYGERPPTETSPGQEPRTLPVTGPMPTPVPTGNGGSLAAVHIAKFRGDSIGVPADGEMPAVTANSHIKRPGGAPPLGVVAAYMAQMNTDMVGHSMEEPVSTIVQKACTQAFVAASLVRQFGTATGKPADEPMPTAMPDGAGGKTGLSAAMLVKYYGEGDQHQEMDEALHTATAKARFAAARCELDDAPGLTEEQRYAAWWVARFIEDYAPVEAPKPRRRGKRGSLPSAVVQVPTVSAIWIGRPRMLTVGEWAIVDIGLRMLKRRELFNAQGFRRDYVITQGLFVDFEGAEPVWRPLTITASIRMAGNSVCPGMARALVASNCNEPVRAEAVA